MRITYSREGGFAGIPMEVSVDTAQLEPNQAESLERLVRDSGFFELAPEGDVKPDVFLHAITVEDGDRRHTVRTTDPVPPSLAPLLDRLRELARPSSS